MGSVGKCPDELEDTGIDGIQQFLSFCHNWGEEEVVKICAYVTIIVTHPARLRDLHFASVSL